MTEREEIDLLRRELADLRERVARLEGEKLESGVPLSCLGLGPDGRLFPSSPLPYNPNISISPTYTSDCGCAAGTMCMSVACPRRQSMVLAGAGLPGA